MLSWILNAYYCWQSHIFLKWLFQLTCCYHNLELAENCEPWLFQTNHVPLMGRSSVSSHQSSGRSPRHSHASTCIVTVTYRHFAHRCNTTAICVVQLWVFPQSLQSSLPTLLIVVLYHNKLSIADSILEASFKWSDFVGGNIWAFCTAQHQDSINPSKYLSQISIQSSASLQECNFWQLSTNVSCLECSSEISFF